MEKKKVDSAKVKKSYKKPIVNSDVYLEKGALACNKMGGVSRRCNSSPGVS